MKKMPEYANLSSTLAPEHMWALQAQYNDKIPCSKAMSKFCMDSLARDGTELALTKSLPNAKDKSPERQKKQRKRPGFANSLTHKDNRRCMRSFWSTRQSKPTRSFWQDAQWLDQSATSTGRLTTRPRKNGPNNVTHGPHRVSRQRVGKLGMSGQTWSTWQDSIHTAANGKADAPLWQPENRWMTGRWMIRSVVSKRSILYPRRSSTSIQVNRSIQIHLRRSSTDTQTNRLPTPLLIQQQTLSRTSLLLLGVRGVKVTRKALASSAGRFPRLSSLWETWQFRTEAARFMSLFSLGLMTPLSACPAYQCPSVWPV